MMAAWNVGGNVRNSGASNELAIKVGANAWEYDTDAIPSAGVDLTAVDLGENTASTNVADVSNLNDTYYLDNIKLHADDDNVGL